MKVITLYTLPTCGICHMIKTKLQQRNIPFEEKDFSLIAHAIQSDRAPALCLEEDGKHTILNSVSGMVTWINSYQG